MILLVLLLILQVNAFTGDFFEECIDIFNPNKKTAAAKIYSCSESLYLEQGDIKTATALSLKAFNMYCEKKDFKNAVQPLRFMVAYLGVAPTSVYTLCNNTQQLDCSYFKAKILEDEGQAGSALELYSRSGGVLESLRISALTGESFVPADYLKNYYAGIYSVSRGEWNNAINNFSLFKRDKFLPVYFYLGYSHVMMGNLDVAQALIDNCADCSIGEKLDRIKLEGLLYYAKNDIFNAVQKFFVVLRYTPADFFSRMFVAQIYYRMGWFEKAEELMSNIIGREWRDTELFYLLKERAEMRVRNKKNDLAKADADKILKEYPDRTDFYVDWITWNINYNNGQGLEPYIEKLKLKKDQYSQGLYEYVQGLVDEYKINDANALEHFKKADKIYPSVIYKNKIKSSLRNLYRSGEKDYLPEVCDDYKVYSIGEDKYLVESAKFGEQYPIKYLVEKHNDFYQVTLFLNFESEPWVNYIPYMKSWINYAEKVWSAHGMKLRIQDTYNDRSLFDIKIKVFSWPSSLFISRISSHTWSILSSEKSIAHEVGHLLGLDDEYFELEGDILSRNTNRFIGNRTSIMRNILNGQPEKKHIQNILYPIKCRHIDTRRSVK